MENTNLLIIFFTGLVTGGLTCLAVQGGLLASLISQQSTETDAPAHGKLIIYFLIAKLVAYTILGLLLGWFGSFFTLSLKAQAALQLIVALFMIGTALNMLQVHPFFRYFVIQPPKFLTRLVRNQSKSKAVFAPALLGAFTVFIPCGTTQAMMALAIASGSPIYGAAILFAFILGTAPLFFILGYFTTKMGETYQAKFFKIAAAAIILLALYNVRGALVLNGLNLNTTSKQSVVSQVNNEPTVTINSNGYTPKNITISAGQKITLHIKNKNAYSCAQAFTIPKLGVQKIVRPGDEAIITFTAPNKPGTMTFSCSMGMYQGTFTII